MGASGRENVRRRKGLTWVVVAVLVAGAAVVAGWLGTRGPHYDEDVSGARGAVPIAFGTGAPAAPGRVVRRARDSYGVLGGLSLGALTDAAGDQRGIMARSLRTGRTYWTYRRHAADVGMLAADRSTLVVWWNDGLITALDPRTGRPRWHVRESWNDAGTGDHQAPAIAVDDGVVVAVRMDQVTGYAGTTGRRLWRTPAPKDCGWEDPLITGLRGVVATLIECGDGVPHRYGLDTRTGAVRWRVADPLQTLLPAGDHTLATTEYGGRTRAVVDLSGAKPVITTRRFRDDQPSVAATPGLLLCADNRAVDPDGALVAYGLTGGRSRWRRAPARGTVFGAPLLADGKVYVVQQPRPKNADTPGTGTARLLTLDAATGRRLHATTLPALARDEVSKDLGSHPALVPVQATAGVVTVGWNGGGLFSTATSDLLVVS
jgi:outer membrane protein assembly factor BamB